MGSSKLATTMDLHTQSCSHDSTTLFSQAGTASSTLTEGLQVDPGRLLSQGFGFRVREATYPKEFRKRTSDKKPYAVEQKVIFLGDSGRRSLRQLISDTALVRCQYLYTHTHIKDFLKMMYLTPQDGTKSLLQQTCTQSRV